MARAIRRDPIGFGCAVSLDRMRTPTSVMISHGDMRMCLPVYGTWPLDDLSPSGVADLLDDLHRDSGLRVGIPNAQAVGLESLTAHAFALAHAHRDPDPRIAYEADGSVEIEVCMEEGGTYAFWVNLADGPEGAHRLGVDEAMLTRLVGYVPVPCHVWSVSDEHGCMDCIGQSASESEGIMVLARPLDAMETLRMHRAITGDVDS